MYGIFLHVHRKNLVKEKKSPSRRYMREPELRIGYQLIINDPREGGQLTIN